MRNVTIPLEEYQELIKGKQKIYDDCFKQFEDRIKMLTDDKSALRRMYVKKDVEAFDLKYRNLWQRIINR
jgi:hypothetical protein